MAEQFEAGQKVRIIGNTEDAKHHLPIGSIAHLVTGEVDAAAAVLEVYWVAGSDCHQWIERETFEVINDDN